MTFRSIYWDDEGARLKGFSATTKSGASSIVKIEIDVRDPYRLASLLQCLEEIRQEQAAAGREAPSPKRTASRRRTIDRNPAPLLLTYCEED